ncbi:hypothetical protein HDF26_002757 [Pedobacter cryoconitis]|uniref:hypothetical protein n=1 Tax=Pedobacter cryoconitis TaxID=188932 RepID=UPI00162080C8|nr:hypothetical protein [Pedobacter cryoconitis]MBB6272300.1 hypothetical protein [Pedobacter cryoconitis]
MKTIHTQSSIYAMLEISFTTEMRAAFAMYCQMVSIHCHFGFFSQTTSKDFIK